MSQVPFYQQCLSDELARRMERRPGYSLRAFAQALKLDPAALSRILSGQKVPSYRLSKQVFGALGLTPEEEMRFLESVTRARQVNGYKRFSPELKKFKTDTYDRPVELSLDAFRIVSDWYHYAILLLTCTPGFKPDPKRIARQLGISPSEAKLGLQRLVALELLRVENGAYVMTNGHITTADKSMTTTAQRRRQRQILEKAIDSLENDPIGIRNTSAMTMAIDPERLPAAKKKIEAFTNELCGFLEGGERRQVYEMSISLFPLQKGKQV